MAYPSKSARAADADPLTDANRATTRACVDTACGQKPAHTGATT